MIQIITTEQLAQELNAKITGSRYYVNNEIFYQNLLVDLATAIDDHNIRLDFHWAENHPRPAYVTYATEEWVQLTDQIEAFKILKELNQSMLFRSQNDVPNEKKILELQEELVLRGFDVTCHHHYTKEDMLKNKERGIFYYTIERVKE